MSIYTQVAIAFMSVAIFARIAKKINSFYPPFYIFAGIITGPVFLNLVVNDEIIGLFSEIGIVFLLFYLGFEFSLQTFFQRKKTLIIAGSIDFIINFTIGFFLGNFLGFDLFHSFVLAGIVYMSSSGIITKALIHINAVKDPEGELVMGIMVFEDLIMVIYLVLISSINNQTKELSLINIGFELGTALLFCGVLLFIGIKFHSQIDNFLQSKSEEVTLLSFLGLVFIITATGVQLGVSEALGAFFLGMAISQGESKEKVERTSLKFRDVFGSIYFFYFGMNFSLEGLQQYLFWVIIAIIIASTGKIITGFIISKFLKCSTIKGSFIGLVILSRGEFSLLIAGIIGSNYFPFESFAVVLIIGTALISTLGFRIFDILCEHKKICLLEQKPMD